MAKKHCYELKQLILIRKLQQAQFTISSRLFFNTNVLLTSCQLRILMMSQTNSTFLLLLLTLCLLQR